MKKKELGSIITILRKDERRIVKCNIRMKDNSTGVMDNRIISLSIYSYVIIGTDPQCFLKYIRDAFKYPEKSGRKENPITILDDWIIREKYVL